MSELFPDKRSRKKAARSKVGVSHVIAVSVASALLILFVLVFVASAFYLIDRSQQAEPAFVQITTTTSTTTTTALATTSLLFGYTTAPSTSTTVYTTTTIACGGDYQPPCSVEGVWVCEEGAILGSDFLCKIPSCAPTTPSGRVGCGSWALDWLERCSNKLMPGPR